MENILENILSMSIISSSCVPFILIARLLLKNAPKNFSYALWGIMLFRLIVPISFVTPWGIFPSRLSFDEYGKYMGTGKLQQILPLQELNPYLTGFWLCGVVVMLAYALISLYKLKEKLVFTTEISEQIYLADEIETPFVFGVLSPKIYLPSHISHHEKSYIISHEAYHIHRKDHIIRGIAYLFLCFHWFNPIIWLAYGLSGKDMELSCDEAVLAEESKKLRGDYATSLLKFSREKDMAPVTFSEPEVKGRVKYMLNMKERGFWTNVFATTLLLVVFVACGTDHGPKIEEELYSPTPDRLFWFEVGEMYEDMDYGLRREMHNTSFRPMSILMEGDLERVQQTLGSKEKAYALIDSYCADYESIIFPTEEIQEKYLSLQEHQRNFVQSLKAEVDFVFQDWSDYSLLEIEEAYKILRNETLLHFERTQFTVSEMGAMLLPEQATEVEEETEVKFSDLDYIKLALEEAFRDKGLYDTQGEFDAVTISRFEQSPLLQATEGYGFAIMGSYHFQSGVFVCFDKSSEVVPYVHRKDENGVITVEIPEKHGVWYYYNFVQENFDKEYLYELKTEFNLFNMGNPPDGMEFQINHDYDSLRCELDVQAREYLKELDRQVVIFDIEDLCLETVAQVGELANYDTYPNFLGNIEVLEGENRFLLETSVEGEDIVLRKYPLFSENMRISTELEDVKVSFNPKEREHTTPDGICIIYPTVNLATWAYFTSTVYEGLEAVEEYHFSKETGELIPDVTG